MPTNATETASQQQPNEIPHFEELTFEEKRHIYRLDENVIPSVSTIMKPLSQAMYGDVDEAVLNKAAERGTIVHNAIENHILFGVSDIPIEHDGYLRAFKQWWKDTKPEVLATERRVYHRILRYAGTVDLLALIDGKRILIDYKTSASVNRMLTGVQLEAYAKAYESHGIGCDGKAILHLKSDGKYELVPYEKNDSENWETFSALLTVYAHIKKYKRR